MVAKNLIRSPNLASLLILAMAEPTYAGAWTLQRGHVWAEFYWQQYRADHDFDRSGQRTRMANGGEFREFRNEFKVESAPPWWADRFNVVGSLPIEYARYIDRNVTLTNRGAEEATVAAKWSMNEVGAAVIVAVQAGVRFPGCDASDQPPLADCQTDVEGRVILSRGLITDAEGVITRLRERRDWLSDAPSGAD